MNTLKPKLKEGKLTTYEKPKSSRQQTIMGLGASKSAVSSVATRAGAAVTTAAAPKGATTTTATVATPMAPRSSSAPAPAATHHPQPVPEPDPLTGFYRGQAWTDRERSQQQFLMEQQKNVPKEMPPELIKFLYDMGPVQKVEDTSIPTSRGVPAATKQKRAPRALRDEQFEETAVDPGKQQHSARTTDTRQRHNMPLVQGIEGFETMRTTNFSEKGEKEDLNDVGLDLLDIYSLLRGNNVVNAALGEAARNKQEKLLLQTKQYIGLPVLLKDSDGSYVGAWSEKVDDLQTEHKGMHLLSKTKAIAVLEDLWEIDQAQKQDA